MNYPTFIFEAVNYNVRLTKILKMLDLFNEYEGKALNFRILPQILEINKKTFYRQLAFLKEINAISVTETHKRHLKSVKINGFSDIIKKNQSTSESLQSGSSSTDISNFPSNHLLFQSNNFLEERKEMEVVMEETKPEFGNLEKESEKQIETESQNNTTVKDNATQFETESQFIPIAQNRVKFCYRFSICVENQGVRNEFVIAEGESELDLSQFLGKNVKNLEEKKEKEKVIQKEKEKKEERIILYNNIYNNTNNVNNNVDAKEELQERICTTDVNNDLDTKEVLQERISTKAKDKKIKKANLILPDWLPLDLWNEYLNMRKMIKKPLTEYGQQLAIKNLEKFRNQGYDIIQIIEQSISNCWLGFFPPKEQQGLFSYSNKAATPSKRQFRNKMLERTESAWIDQYYEDIKPILEDLREKERQFFGSSGSV